MKINANIGTSPHDVSLEKEQAKLAAALKYGADAVMDLSTGGPLDELRTALLAQCPAPFGTVPIYQVMTEAKSLDEVKGDWFLDMVEHHAQQGVDFVTVHCGVTRKALPLLAKESPAWSPGAGPFSRPGCGAINGKTPYTSNMTGCCKSPGTMTSPCLWGTACAPGAWPTPPTGPSSTN